MFDHIHAVHLNILLLLGLALLGGTLGGRLFQKLRIPQVVGYIAIGIAIGASGLKLIGHETVMILQPFNYFALGLIGFMIGGELKKEMLAKYGRQFFTILLMEGVTAFLVVSIAVGVTGSFLLGDWRLAWALGLLLGAIASATAPAATAEVLREYKTRGPLTKMVLGIVAMDDALALLLFSLAVSVSGYLSGNSHGETLRTFMQPLYQIGGAVFIGVALGLALNKLLRKYEDQARMLVFSIGAVLIALGLTLAMRTDVILAAMTLGIVVTNSIPRKSKEVFKLVTGFTPPIYILFFVLVGAKLNISYMTLPIVVLGALYLAGRTAGKAFGANFGARISGAARSVRKYLPCCLFSQAGVAIGLSILAGHYFPEKLGDIVIVIVTANTFILEIIGPPCVKWAVTRAGEVGLNISEDDLTREMKTEEVMDKNPPLIYENMTLPRILAFFSESPNLYYPVVDNQRKLRGVITVDNIKNTFMEAGLSDLLVAADVMEPAAATLSPESSVAELKETMAKDNLEYLAVVEAGKLAGFVERRALNKIMATKVMEIRRQADSLENDVL